MQPKNSCQNKAQFFSLLHPKIRSKSLSQDLVIMQRKRECYVCIIINYNHVPVFKICITPFDIVWWTSLTLISLCLKGWKLYLKLVCHFRTSLFYLLIFFFWEIWLQSFKLLFLTGLTSFLIFSSTTFTRLYHGQEDIHSYRWGHYYIQPLNEENFQIISTKRITTTAPPLRQGLLMTINQIDRQNFQNQITWEKNAFNAKVDYMQL